ncbi:unnamed protein product [Echinostoma caproni]|uniref:Uncharacterized protein n=1 Tax=Echinostoma caproni TaxID=27848 RepID=A0A182ZZD5_9TREM|nr:unnamed protein product [Echinostoma caproni]
MGEVVEEELIVNVAMDAKPVLVVDVRKDRVNAPVASVVVRVALPVNRFVVLYNLRFSF